MPAADRRSDRRAAASAAESIASSARRPDRQWDDRAARRTRRTPARGPPIRPRRPETTDQRRTRLAGGGDLDPLGVAPQPFEAVEHPRLRTEDVHDEVEVVEEDPFR